jgi:hypothetical protein
MIEQLIPDGFIVTYDLYSLQVVPSCGACDRDIEAEGPWLLHLDTMQVLCDRCLTKWPFETDEP